MATGSNIFPRYTGGKINLEARQSAGGPAPSDVFIVSLKVLPELLQLGAATAVSVTITKNAEPLVGYVIDITTTNAAVGLVPEQVYSAELGIAQFSIIGIAVGSTDLTASLTMEGEIFTSQTINLTVTAQEPPENYDTTGYGRVVFTVEPALAEGLRPKITRLSHQEQFQKYKNDSGLLYAHYFASAEVIFIPKQFYEK